MTDIINEILELQAESEQYLSSVELRKLNVLSHVLSQSTDAIMEAAPVTLESLIVHWFSATIKDAATGDVIVSGIAVPNIGDIVYDNGMSKRITKENFNCYSYNVVGLLNGDILKCTSPDDCRVKVDNDTSAFMLAALDDLMYEEIQEMLVGTHIIGGKQTEFNINLLTPEQRSNIFFTKDKTVH